MTDLTAYLDMPLGVHAPTAARRAVVAVLHGWGFRDEAWLDAAAVVTSELVTNAVRYGGGCVEFRIEARAGQVVLSVADTSPEPPRPRDPDVDGGRGLTLIEASSTQWGVHHHDGGKRVWVQLTPCTDVTVNQSAHTTGHHHEHHSTRRPRS